MEPFKIFKFLSSRVYPTFNLRLRQACQKTLRAWALVVSGIALSLHFYSAKGFEPGRVPVPALASVLKTQKVFMTKSSWVTFQPFFWMIFLPTANALNAIDAVERTS